MIDAIDAAAVAASTKHKKNFEIPKKQPEKRKTSQSKDDIAIPQIVLPRHSLPTGCSFEPWSSEQLKTQQKTSPESTPQAKHLLCTFPFSFPALPQSNEFDVDFSRAHSAFEPDNGMILTDPNEEAESIKSEPTEENCDEISMPSTLSHQPSEPYDQLDEEWKKLRELLFK